MPDPNDRISEIYQASRRHLEPPAELDRRILDEAHRAVAHRRHVPYRSLALAATVVLGVGLAWLQLYAPQIVEEAAVPMRDTTPRPTVHGYEYGTTNSIEAMKQREPASPMPMPRQAPPARPQFHSYNGGVSDPPAADLSFAAKAEAERALPGTDLPLPCGLAVRPADEAAWYAAIQDAETRGDSQTAACLRQALQTATGDAGR